MKMPDQKLWRQSWTEGEAKRILERAQHYKLFGASDIQAWRKAEEWYSVRRDPFASRKG